MIRSVRFKLTLWYMVILAMTLCLFGWVLYTNVKVSLVRDVDDLLASQADGVADTIFAFLEAQWKGKEASPASDLQKEIEKGQFSSLIKSWARETREIENTRHIRIIDRKGRVLYVTRSFAQLVLPITETVKKQAALSWTVYETFALSDRRVRLITRPIVEESKMLYVIQVASSFKQADDSLGRLRLWLFWLIPLTILITSALGSFLAKTALKPVDRMTSHAQRISANHLHERIDVPKTGDELERLATTFNAMLARLERTFRRVRQFSAAASHELRTPLTIMKGELELALRRPRTTEEYQNALRTHLEALNEMSQIVEELLILARSDDGEAAIDWRPLELGALVKRAQEFWRKISAKKDIQLQIHVNGPLWVKGEQHLLERLLANLLDNAVKHTPPKGKVTLTVDHEENSVRMIVKDTGSGISAEELPRIFDRFFRRAPGEGHSTGIGLGLCRWIVEAHQGKIEVQSVLGQGATFTVLLPKMKNL